MDHSAHAATVFNKLATQYQERFMYLDLYNDTFDLFCDNIPKQHAAILELACGPGNITKYLLNKRPDFRILGTDLAPNMIALAKANNPGATFQVMDCRTIDVIEAKFDAVMIGFCLPYLNMQEVSKLITDVSGLLHADGVVYISTMEDAYSNSGLQKSSNGDEVYMHYYTAADIMPILESNHFHIISIQRKDFTQKDGSITKDLIVIAKH